MPSQNIQTGMPEDGVRKCKGTGQAAEAAKDRGVPDAEPFPQWCGDGSVNPAEEIQDRPYACTGAHPEPVLLWMQNRRDELHEVLQIYAGPGEVRPGNGKCINQKSKRDIDLA